MKNMPPKKAFSFVCLGFITFFAFTFIFGKTVLAQESRVNTIIIQQDSTFVDHANTIDGLEPNAGTRILAMVGTS